MSLRNEFIPKRHEKSINQSELSLNGWTRRAYAQSRNSLHAPQLALPAFSV
ncbi:hypothetical protein [Leisingera sp. ANG-M7]|uniref:hypothetical protein n=1 Tax=Leisingera sp. ANG-M7 TaxID=1577902 RepID=UPI000A7CB83A|nr:hypothetical protein [Leisingera sp. ANG-M7]